MNAETLMELAGRVEAASGPDRELDFAIDIVVRPNEWVASVRESGNPGCPVHWFTDDELPLYTASIDAALTLVPEGMALGVTNIEGGDYETMDFSCCTAVVHGGHADLCRSEAFTPALALAAAALKARAQEGK